MTSRNSNNPLVALVLKPMNLIKSFQSRQNDSQPGKELPWLDALFIALLAILCLAFPIAINKFGLLTLVGMIGVLLAIGVFLQPETGMLAYLLITYTQFSNVAITTYGFPSLIQPLAGLMMLVMLIRTFIHGERPLNGVRVAQIMAVYVITWALPLLNTDSYEIVSEALMFNAKRILGGIIVIFFIQRPESIRRAVWAIIVAGLIMGTISAYQNMTGTFENEYWGFGNWLRAEDSNMYTRRRLTGPYGDPNPYAQILVVVVVLAFERILNEKRNILRLIAGWSLVACVLTTFFTYSRGSGFLNLFFTLGIFIYFLRERMVVPSIVAIIFGAIAMQFLPSTYLVRMVTLTELLPSSGKQITDPSFLHRLNENTASWQMFLDHPLIGVGIGNFPNMYTQYGAKSGFSASAGPVAAPSLYAELISEQGILGSAIFAVIIFFVFRDLLRAHKLYKEVGRPDMAAMAAALFAAMTGYMFSGLFKQSAYSNVFWVLIGIAVAMYQVAQRLFMEAENNPKKPQKLVEQ